VCTEQLVKNLGSDAAACDFYVVGALGFQGVGKSRMLSELCGYRRMLPPPGADGEEDGPGRLIGRFAEQSWREVLEGAHRTTGVDACVSAAEQLILLDVQPLMSASLLAERLRPSEAATTAAAVRPIAPRPQGTPPA
jgi:hypothetical protein